MKTIVFSGYIDNEVLFGDEVTPDMLRSQLNAGDPNEDVLLIINSFGGSCTAAIEMFEDIRGYKGNVHGRIQIAASAATVVSQACHTLSMSPVGIFMVHRPSSFALGNEDDMMAEIQTLRAFNESIINAYAPRCARKNVTRDDIAGIVRASTWMDANAALEKGFVDEIRDAAEEGGKATNTVTNCVINREVAMERVKAWEERDKKRRVAARLGFSNAQIKAMLTPSSFPATDDLVKLETAAPKDDDVVPADQLHKRLDLIKK